MIAAAMVIATFSAAEMVLELDVDATVMQDYDMLEVEGAGDGMENEGVANR